MSPAPDFRLYHGNALDVLAGLLAEELRSNVPDQSLLAPDTILIPQVAMRRWLQATLAARHGIAANLEFLTPGEFVARALDSNLGASKDDLDLDTLHWRLHAALSDPALRGKLAMAQLAAYLADADPLKSWSLAGELANVFNKYQAWRRDWLLRWDGGADPEDPQAILWRAVAAGRQHRARRIQDYLARFSDGDALPVGLPRRLFAFGTLNISPDVLRVLATQSRVGTLHFYLPTPTKHYWGDLQSLGARLREGVEPFGDEARENPLLRDWGAAGKDFMALLGSYEVVHPSGEIAAYADPAEGANDGLLQRMQADLFHRRVEPSGSKRDGVDAADASLQFHACHTRLRELQVLHDRLRALLEDNRFDPPLQPRDIAVLAPDIDPYVPYLDAVFGSDGHAGQAIPYALADASPLAGEQLADVFLRLLALPVSRFGLEEVLDLLASPPLAEAAGLDAADFERLHGWLHAAGARWGIDARHRERQGGPQDDAYTWQFALDRLLLGHASGSEDHIAGVAPWPELEGGALAALDALLKMLRTLARNERVLGEAMPPAQWRERLLGLLDALLPRPPSTTSGQRALDRLRTLVDDFAKQAHKAGFDAPLAAEIVRAHFTARLTEADIRAPLLTGGVSFARMVPMRLLPFRAICLLGMNDGDFPRRDSTAGLNRLTADLGTDRRRHGDRSTRDDDRYLFLQLFSAAQDVFYLSWLGADPRDGSAREPSALVSELLAAAGDYHAQPEKAVSALVLRHPLQPFSPAAFGADDARLFSYRGHWHPAAGRLSGSRESLAPWLETATLLASPLEAETDLSLDALRRFLQAPAEQFLRQRLGLRLPELEAAAEDIEPLQAAARGLDRMALQRAVFDRLLEGDAATAMQPALRARGLLPSGPLGARALAEVIKEVAPYAQAFAQWRSGDEPTSHALHVDIDGLRLHGRLGDVWPNGIARLRFGKPNGNSSIRNGLDWLLASAAGFDVPFVEVRDDVDAGIDAHVRAPLSQGEAIDALRSLMTLRRDGLQQPLPFAPCSGWELFSAEDSERGIRNAAARWRGGDRQWGEGDSDAIRLALRGRDPFADPAALRDFARITGIVFGSVTRGIPMAIELGDAMLPDDDAEDAA
ncbi:exodeoxyribonuclease V subunit gamma [Thermomonas carbonis]|uniref:RecBCD enzyme subunit RecC n=1 Tax=Thermomonas carbonis TaxID=1463158 RepID=A0A7G9ST40_9GAMM|nr:exodeoxyribonuclease V subunit gamma [Thermomonas carbonis]QNN71015.1 exodeoxyribonuclease V subunit gamma [Thermomonas carbonis]GHC03942.1 RecBCD enzyme subunit RecC [Thermomonas carbonis]